MTIPSAARDCHPEGLPPVIRPGHPEDGTSYTVTSSGTVWDKTRNLADAHNAAADRSVMGAACVLTHEHSDGTSCFVARYQYGGRVYGQGVL